MKKFILSVLTLLMCFSLVSFNTEINVVNADDETSCAIYLYTKVDRDIKYVYEDGSTAKPTVHQEADFDGTLTFDNVTGHTVDYGAFTPESKTLAEVVSPTIQGYTPDKATVNELVVRGYGKKHFEDIVTYSPVTQKMFVYFKTGDTVLKTIEETGRSDEDFTYDSTNDLEEFKNLGYEVVEDEYAAEQNKKYDTDPDVDQEYVITLRKRQSQETEEVTVSRIIEYKLNSPTGLDVADPVEQEAQFSRSCTTIGLETTCGEWTPESFEFEAVNSPAVDDLTPSREVVDAVTVTGDSKNIYEVVIYVEDPEQFANIKIIDISNNTTLNNIDLSGKSGEEIGYDVNPRLNELVSHGYEVVENPYSSDILYDDDADTDQLFVIKVQPRFTTCSIEEPCEPCRNDACDPTPDEPQDEDNLKITLYRTIEYIYAEDDSEAAPTKRQTMTFARQAVVNRVTGEYWFEELEPGQSDFEAVTSPEITGYTADKTVVEAKNIARSVPMALIPQAEPYKVENIIVTYTRVPQQAVIHFVDTEGKEIHTDYSFGGGSLTDFPESVGTDKDGIITSLIEVGYELVTDGYVDEPNKKFDNDSDILQEFTVTLKEKVVIITPDDPKVPGEPACEEPCKVQYPEGLTYNDLNKEFVRTIHHVDTNDVKLLDDATQDAAERYTYEYNLVTKVLRLLDTKVENYPEYKTPDIDKMSKDRDVVPADTRLENLEETVVYSKIIYKVTFIDDLTGEELKVEEVEPGNDAIAPEIPVHENYIANGWDKDFTNVQSDLIVRVTFTPTVKPVCTVKFMDGLTGKLIDVQQVECGTGAKDPGKPEHENYTTGDWDKPFDKVDVPELIVTVNYERKKCRMMFIDGLVEKEDVCKIWGDKYTGGGLIADIEYNCGDPVTPPTPKKHDGYEFDGWEKANCSMIIYAKYRKITVKPMVPTGTANILESLFNIFR